MVFDCSKAIVFACNFNFIYMYIDDGSDSDVTSWNFRLSCAVTTPVMELAINQHSEQCAVLSQSTAAKSQTDTSRLKEAPPSLIHLQNDIAGSGGLRF